ncbi:hypothetical protein NGM07_10860 [Halorussus vallis]|uniref:hypothetical protein n=1 Tax=Halorussus vallis TaxID=2953749 RepID=UPI0020A1CFBF|nr:hypothetical protein [Halorussus vallis]USZ73957.1 hypothetical protein NGM07_10860 [Halorussus vallis]
MVGLAGVVAVALGAYVIYVAPGLVRRLNRLTDRPPGESIADVWAVRFVGALVVGYGVTLLVG